MEKRESKLWPFPLVIIAILGGLILSTPFVFIMKNYYPDFILDDLESMKATYQYFEEVSAGRGSTSYIVFFSDADYMCVPSIYCSSEFRKKMDALVPGTIVDMLVLDIGKNKDIVDLKANGNSILNLEESRRMNKRNRIGYSIIIVVLCLYPVWYALYKIFRREVVWWPLWGECPEGFFDDSENSEELKE